MDGYCSLVILVAEAILFCSTATLPDGRGTVKILEQSFAFGGCTTLWSIGILQEQYDLKFVMIFECHLPT